jgi:hypothetical protein
MTSPQRNLEEYSERQKRRAERDAVRRKSAEYTHEFWKRLVKNVGEPEAKDIMRHVMGDKKPGPPRTDEDIALTMLIYAYLFHWGSHQTDAKIAERIFESEPRYLELKSGAIIFANSDFSETYVSLPDDPIVGRRPIDLKLAAIKKRVERIRRWAIEEDELPKAYAPRPYRRD